MNQEFEPDLEVFQSLEDQGLINSGANASARRLRELALEVTPLLRRSNDLRKLDI